MVINGIEVDRGPRSRPTASAAPTGPDPSGSPSGAATRTRRRALEQLRGRPVGTTPRDAGRADAPDRRAPTSGPTTAARRTRTGTCVLGRTDAVLLDAPVALYYGELPGLTTLPAGFGEIRYAVVTRRGDAALRDCGERGAGGADRRRDAPPHPRPLGAVDRGERPACSGVADAPGGPRGGARRAGGARNAAPPGGASGPGPVLARARARRRGHAGHLARRDGAGDPARRRPGAGPGLRARGRSRLLALGYVELFRGTPLLLQLIVVYYGLPELGRPPEPAGSPAGSRWG